MIRPLRLAGYFQVLAVFALVLIAWRGLEIASSGLFSNPLFRAAVAQDGTGETEGEAEGEGEPAPEAEAAPDGASETDPGTDDTPLRIRASDIMRQRATDVTENMGNGDGPVESEETVLTRLGERRARIEQLEEELAMRERLIEAAEKRIEDRIRELKAIEARLNAEMEAAPEEEAPALANLVVMYEAMKPKDAARIFNTLDMNVLVAVVEQMKPRTMSAIMAAMDSQAAQRLTLSLARREAIATQNGQSRDLPKIGADG